MWILKANTLYREVIARLCNFFWNKSLEIGIYEIDDQHRKLLDLINLFATNITEGGRLLDVQTLLDQLMEYATIHFRDEERIMALCSLFGKQ